MSERERSASADTLISASTRQLNDQPSAGQPPILIVAQATALQGLRLFNDCGGDQRHQIVGPTVALFRCDFCIAA